MSMFDKNISQEKLKSLEFAEAAREQEWKAPSFALKLFHGSLDFNLIHPFPKEDPRAEKSCAMSTWLKLRNFYVKILIRMKLI